MRNERQLKETSSLIDDDDRDDDAKRDEGSEHKRHLKMRGLAGTNYYDMNDFLAREHAVSVKFEYGAKDLGRELGASGADAPEDHRANVPLWWMDGALTPDHAFIDEPPGCLTEEFWKTLEAEDGAKIADLRSVNESYFGFGAAFVDALMRQEDDDGAMETSEGLNRALTKRWQELLLEACGRSDEGSKLERLLTREERVVWEAGRAPQLDYERWKYGRDTKVEATKVIQDAKRMRR